MDPERFTEEAFKKDSRIRYVGIIDNQFHIIVSKMRESVQSVTSEEQERNFIQLMPPIIVDSVEKLQPLLGKLDNVTVRYEKMLLVFFRPEPHRCAQLQSECLDTVHEFAFRNNANTEHFSSVAQARQDDSL